MITFPAGPGDCEKCGDPLPNRTYGQKCEDCYIGNRAAVPRGVVRRVIGRTESMTRIEDAAAKVKISEVDNDKKRPKPKRKP